MFFVAFLDSQPRLRLSDDHLKSILWVMKECGTPNVPSFSALRKLQARLKSVIGPASQHHVSTLGNEFYMNSAAQIFRLVSFSSFHSLDGILTYRAGFREPTCPSAASSVFRGVTIDLRILSSGTSEDREVRPLTVNVGRL